MQKEVVELCHRTVLEKKNKHICFRLFFAFSRRQCRTGKNISLKFLCCTRYCVSLVVIAIVSSKLSVAST